MFDRSNISEANEIMGSQKGSQRWQIPGDTRPRLATVGAARRHVGPHPAASSDVGRVPPKQEGRRFEPARARITKMPQPWQHAPSVPVAGLAPDTQLRCALLKYSRAGRGFGCEGQR